MARTTIYCVQSFERKGSKLAQLQLRQFKREDEARRNGEHTSTRALGVLVYKVEADIEFDDWGDPVMLASYGEVPDDNV